MVIPEMSEYTAIFTISASLLFVLFVVGLGAGQYIGVDDTGESNFTFTQDELDLDLSNASNFDDTFYDNEADVVRVNKTAYNNQFFKTPPAAWYGSDVAVDAFVVEVNKTEDAEMRFKQGLSVRTLDDGENTFENVVSGGSNFRVVWDTRDGNTTETLNATLDSVTLLPDSDVNTQSFTDNLTQLFEFSSGNPFIAQVILPAAFLVLGLIIISVLPFFGG